MSFVSLTRFFECELGFRQTHYVIIALPYLVHWNCFENKSSNYISLQGNRNFSKWLIFLIVVVFEGVCKVVHKLPEPAAPQHEPHRQQALQLQCLWQEILTGTHPEETPTHSHISTASSQAWTQTSTVQLLFVFEIPLEWSIPFQYLFFPLCFSMQLCNVDSEGTTQLFPCPQCPSRFNTEAQLNHHK